MRYAGLKLSLLDIVPPDLLARDGCVSANVPMLLCLAYMATDASLATDVFTLTGVTPAKHATFGRSAKLNDRWTQPVHTMILCTVLKASAAFSLDTQVCRHQQQAMQLLQQHQQAVHTGCCTDHTLCMSAVHADPSLSWQPL